MMTESFLTQWERVINVGKPCPICDWPMADSQEHGCIPGDCCYRPDDPAEQERIRRRRAELTNGDR
jgi:hypothetical protein